MRRWDEWADRMYLKAEGPAHIVPWSTNLSLCGLIGTDMDWFGTGDWDEREVATSLLLCEHCLTRAYPDEDPAVHDWRDAISTHQPTK